MTSSLLQAGKKSKSTLIEEASKERRGKNKIFAHIQKEIETKEHNKPKISENDQVLIAVIFKALDPGLLC